MKIWIKRFSYMVGVTLILVFFMVTLQSYTIYYSDDIYTFAPLKPFYTVIINNAIIYLIPSAILFIIGILIKNK